MYQATTDREAEISAVLEFTLPLVLVGIIQEYDHAHPEQFARDPILFWPCIETDAELHQDISMALLTRLKNALHPKLKRWARTTLEDGLQKAWELPKLNLCDVKQNMDQHRFLLFLTLQKKQPELCFLVSQLQHSEHDAIVIRFLMELCSFGVKCISSEHIPLAKMTRKRIQPKQVKKEG